MALRSANFVLRSAQRMMSTSSVRYLSSLAVLNWINQLITIVILYNRSAEMSFTFAAPNAVHYNAASVKQVRRGGRVVFSF